jgi:predicted RNase H-like HicB family nuclease
MHRLNLQIMLWQEGQYHVAECLNNHVSSFGNTKEEALANLNEALELYYTDENQPTFIRVENPELLESTFAYA